MRYEEESSGKILGKMSSLFKRNTEGMPPSTRFLAVRQLSCHHEESKSVEANRGEEMRRTWVLDDRATEDGAGQAPRFLPSPSQPVELAFSTTHNEGQSIRDPRSTGQDVGSVHIKQYSSDHHQKARESEPVLRPA